MMKLRRLLAILFILGLCISLAPSGGLADGPERTPAISEATLQSILENAVPGPTAGVSFTTEQVSGAGERAAPKNVFPYLAYTADNVNDFYPTSKSDFTVGVGEMWLQAYFAILNHPVQGMAVVHLLINTAGPPHWYYVHDPPDFYGETGQQWRFAMGWAATPDMPGQWVYLPIFLPYDGDGYPVNPQRAVWPLTIHD